MSLLTKYFKTSDGEIHKAMLDYDCDTISPLDDESVAHMMCWHKRYTLGNTNKYESPTEFFKDLLEKNNLQTKIINLVKNKKTSNNLEIAYNRSEKKHELIADYKVWWNGDTVHRGEIASASDITDLFEDIVDALPYNDIIKVLEKSGYYFLPLSIYDHSGISMYIGNRLDHFDGQWDCSNVGWIYTTCTEVNELYGYQNDKTWKHRADQILRDIVNTYDLYLRGECYGICSYDLDTEDMSEHNYTINDIISNPILEDLFFFADEGVGGYYSDDIDALLTETIRCDFGGEIIVNSLEELRQ